MALSKCCVTTGSSEIAIAVRCLGGPAFVRDPTCTNNLQSMGEIARRLTACELFIDLASEKPQDAVNVIDQLLRLFDNYPEVEIATVADPIRDHLQLNDPSCIKVVLTQSDKALYLSRGAVPYAYAPTDSPEHEASHSCYQLAGAWCYRRGCLLQLAALASSPLERLEGVEQLRALENGLPITVLVRR